MREAEEYLINDAVRADRSADRHQVRILGRRWDEMVLIEAEGLLVAGTARHYRDVIDVRFRDHSSHRRLSVSGHEFDFGVAVPDGLEVVARPENTAKQSERA